MNRIEGRGDLHPLRLVDRFSIGHIYTGLFQSRSSVRKIVFHHQIPRCFGIDERRDIGLLGCDQDIHVFDAAFRQHGLGSFAGSWRDLVDHGPGKAYL